MRPSRPRSPLDSFIPRDVRMRGQLGGQAGREGEPGEGGHGVQ